MPRVPKAVEPGLLLLQMLTGGERQPLPRPQVSPSVVELASAQLLNDGRDLLLSRLVSVTLHGRARIDLSVLECGLRMRWLA